MSGTAPARLLPLAAHCPPWQVRKGWAVPGQQLGAQDTGWPQVQGRSTGGPQSHSALLLMGTGGSG